MADWARRQLWVVFALLAIASAVLWGSSRMTWFTTVEQRPGGGSTVRVENGAQHAPVLLAVAVVALAGIAGVLATAGLLRRAVGMLLGLAGVGVLVQAVVGAGGGVGYQYLSSQQPVEPFLTLGQEQLARGLAGLAGVMLLLVGALLVARGHRMPRLGARYRAPGAASRVGDPDRRLWQALDEGEDPTTERSQ